MFLELISRQLHRLKYATQSGQTLVEYGLIVGLIAIAAIVGVSLLGIQVGSLWGGIADDVGTAISDVLGA